MYPIYVKPAEIMMDEDLIRGVYNSANILGICATLDGMADIAISNKNVDQERLIFEFLRKLSPSLKDLDEWNQNCNKHKAIIMLIDEGYNLKLIEGN
ncbi:hypothetical protein NBRC116188_09940 [Oceaniserpentilla sp. 4NH20-0058]